MSEKKEKETMLVACEHCEARVSATVQGSFSSYIEGPDYSFKYSLLQCPICKSPMLVQQNDEEARWGNPEDYNDNPWSVPERIYPEPERGQLGLSVPDPIRKAFAEAYACYANGKAYTACAIMCRKVLEGICGTHGAEGNNLAARLKNLSDKGILDKRLYEWITTLRTVGNEAAHDVEVTVSRDDAKDLLDLAEAVSEYLYTFKEKFEAFKKRREGNGKRRRRPWEVAED